MGERLGGLVSGGLIAVAVLAVLIPGCSAAGDPGLPTITPPTPATATVASTQGSPEPDVGAAAAEADADAAPEAAVLDAYQGYWRTWLAANDPPNPDHPDLERYYTGIALSRARAAIADNLTNGRWFEARPGGGAAHFPSVVTLTADSATVVDCAVDDGLIVDAAGVVDDRVVTNRSTATMKLVAGEWRVEDVVVTDTRLGSGSCDDF